MTVQHLWADGKLVPIKELNFASDSQRLLVKIGILASDATTDAEANTSIGDPTEVALIQVADELGVEEVTYRSQHPRLRELAFDSDRKLMSTLHEIDGEAVLMTKGAIDVLLNRSDFMLTDEGVVPMTAERKAMLEKANDELSHNGLRVRTFANRPCERL